MKNYFLQSEFECKCGCGLNNVSDALIEDLNTAREIATMPFVINSGSRCENHNKSIGGLSSSSHLRGLAVDIKADNSPARLKILQGLILAGFDRIGIHRAFIHVDIDRTKPSNVAWVSK